MVQSNIESENDNKLVDHSKYLTNVGKTLNDFLEMDFCTKTHDVVHHVMHGNLSYVSVERPYSTG